MAQPGLGPMTLAKIQMEGVFGSIMVGGEKETVEAAAPQAVPTQGISCSDIVATHSSYRLLCNKPPHDLRLKIMTTIIL